MQVIKAVALAALMGSVSAKDDSTFAVLRFTNKQLTKGRMDPIISPGETSTHVHTVMGGSGFGKGSTGEDLANSQCSNALIKGDNSNYWFPSLYFYDEGADEFEAVEIFYVNAYYFFEPTDDELKAFPRGMSMVSGDPMTRSPPEGGPNSNLNPDNGPINGIKWTCPRDGNNYEPPSWPADSDGSSAGIGDTVNKGEGVGFPDVDCDGYASPLRADIHFPSCYNPDAGLMSYKDNMAWPSTKDGKLNCPEGYVHVPHLFLEVYWNTPVFADRWTPNTGKQPFVLSNGDATGFSSHADFMAGWDEELLQHIIDTCDAGTSGMDNCAGLFYGVNDEDCTIPSEIDEDVDGTLSKLPGNNPVTGWRFGGEVPDMPEPSSPASSPTPSGGLLDGLPDVADDAATNVVENPAAPTSTKSEEQAPVPKPTEVSEEASLPDQPEKPSQPEQNEQPNNRVHTIWETITVTEEIQAQPTDSKSRRHLHGHGHAHGHVHRRSN